MFVCLFVCLFERERERERCMINLYQFFVCFVFEAGESEIALGSKNSVEGCRCEAEWE